MIDGPTLAALSPPVHGQPHSAGSGQPAGRCASLVLVHPGAVGLATLQLQPSRSAEPKHIMSIFLLAFMCRAAVATPTWLRRGGQPREQEWSLPGCPHGPWALEDALVHFAQCILELETLQPEQQRARKQTGH